MFTGLIEDKGSVLSVKKGAKAAEIAIRSKKITGDLHIGDSVSVNGVCLTVTVIQDDVFHVDAVPETMSRSNLGGLATGSRVNLERALRVGDRLGGHMVSGHVDALGYIQYIEKDENAVWFTFKMESENIKYLVAKGSVAVDGISLTVVDVFEDKFTVSVIPLSLKETVLSDKNLGDSVNIECDMTAKYIERFFTWKGDRQDKKGVSMEDLTKYGFA
ncbi:MAG: riboflavin synthase [Bacteroidota bacterium]